MSQLVDVYRSSVSTWECDQMGHLNVQFYLDKADIGLNILCRQLGLDRQTLSEQQARVHTCEHHVRFIREQHAGAPLTLRAGIIAVNGEQLEVYLELLNPARKEVAASIITTAELRHVSGDPLPLPDSVREQAQRRLVEVPQEHAPHGVARGTPRPAPTLAEANEMGMLHTYLGIVPQTMCEADGGLAVRSYMGIVSEGIPHMLSRIRDSIIPDQRLGGAALEYRWIYYQRPRAGDLVAMRSAIISIGNKAYRLGHWLFDAETGQAIATTEAVAVILDLDARRALVIPDEARTCLQAMVIEDFSI